MVTDQPVGPDKATADVLGIDLPDDVDLAPFAVVEDDIPSGWQHGGSSWPRC